jgi:4-amino-4-deoxy-L-arabinose transferase-like glycosyltransferase
MLLAPVILGNATRLSMNPLEPLFWMGWIYFLFLAIHRQQPKLLLWCGVLLGFGFENKHSTVFFLSALVVGLLATLERRPLTRKWFWIAAAIAFANAFPNVAWEYQHHFPTLEDLRHVKAIHKNVELPPLPFIGQQILVLAPVSALVWIAGLGFLLFHRDGKRYRFLGVTYLVFLGRNDGAQG